MSIPSLQYGHILTGEQRMDLRTFRESHPQRNTRFSFCYWINEKLEPMSLHISVPYLRDLESGRSIPSLALAIAVENISNNSVRVRDWFGLAKRMKS
jgi:hypothetical protein